MEREKSFIESTADQYFINKIQGATPQSIMTLTIRTVSIMIPSITPFRIKTLGITRQVITTPQTRLRIKTLSILRPTMLSVIILSLKTFIRTALCITTISIATLRSTKPQSVMTLRKTSLSITTPSMRVSMEQRILDTNAGKQLS